MATLQPALEYEQALAPRPPTTESKKVDYSRSSVENIIKYLKLGRKAKNVRDLLPEQWAAVCKVAKKKLKVFEGGKNINIKWEYALLQLQEWVNEWKAEEEAENYFPSLEAVVTDEEFSDDDDEQQIAVRKPDKKYTMNMPIPRPIISQFEAAANAISLKKKQQLQLTDSIAGMPISELNLVFDDYPHQLVNGEQNETTERNRGYHNILKNRVVREIAREYGIDNLDELKLENIFQQYRNYEGKSNSDISRSVSDALSKLSSPKEIKQLKVELNNSRVVEQAKLVSEEKWIEDRKASYETMPAAEVVSFLLKAEYANYVLQNKIGFEEDLHETNIAANENLLLSSTIKGIEYMESLEKTNKQLASTNEILQTLNYDLQEKVRKIESLNTDLQRRQRLNMKYRQQMLLVGWVVNPAIVNVKSPEFIEIKGDIEAKCRKWTPEKIKSVAVKHQGFVNDRIGELEDLHRLIHKWCVHVYIYYEIYKTRVGDAIDDIDIDAQARNLAEVDAKMHSLLKKANPTGITPIAVQRMVESDDFDSTDPGNVDVLIDEEKYNAEYRRQPKSKFKL